jgi:VWFA-related protein
MPFDPAVSDFAKKIGHAVIDQLGPNDLAAVTYTFLGRQQNLTSDRQHLDAAIDGVVPHPQNPGAPAPHFSAESHSGGTGGRFTPGPCSLRGPYGCVVDTLIHAADALAAAPAGKKTLIYISTGVPYDFSMHNLALAREIEGLGEMFAALQRANIDVYAIDPLGLTPEGILSKRIDALRIFSESTGGRAVIGTNTPWEEVPEIFQENSSYYLLGVRSTNSKADGKFRSIQVNVDRPGAEVRSRSGYFAPRPEKPDATRARTAALAPVDKAIIAGTPTGDLPIAVTVAPFAEPGRQTALLAVAVGLRRAPDTPVAPEQVEVVVSAFDTEWKARETERQTLRVTPRADASGFTYEALARLHVPPGRYEVRVAAASGEHAGSVFTDLDVPDFHKQALSVSGLVLGVDPPLPGAMKDAFADLMKVVPTPVREFSASTTVTAFMRAYQGGTKPLTSAEVRAAIVDTGDQERVTRTTALEATDFGSGRFASYQWKLPVDGLAPGAYLLRFDIKAGTSSARREARFTIH